MNTVFFYYFFFFIGLFFYLFLFIEVLSNLNVSSSTVFDETQCHEIKSEKEVLRDKVKE